MVKGNGFIKRVIVAGDGEVEGQGSWLRWREGSITLWFYLHKEVHRHRYKKTLWNTKSRYEAISLCKLHSGWSGWTTSTSAISSSKNTLKVSILFFQDRLILQNHQQSQLPRPGYKISELSVKWKNVWYLTLLINGVGKRWGRVFHAGEEEMIDEMQKRRGSFGQEGYVAS